MTASRRLLYAVAAPVIALVVTLIITSIVILISGANPLDAFSNMIDYSTRARGVTSIINQATPLFIAGVAVAIGFQMNLFNIGVEGQYRLAGLIAAWAGAEVALPAPLHVGFIILVAMVVGSLWAGIAGVLKVTRNVNEVISTIMLNQIAFGVDPVAVQRLPAGRGRRDPHRPDRGHPAVRVDAVDRPDRRVLRHRPPRRTQLDLRLRAHRHRPRRALLGRP